MGPNQSRTPQLCEAESQKGRTGVRDYSNWLPLWPRESALHCNNLSWEHLKISLKSVPHIKFLPFAIKFGSLGRPAL
jgi:hypothetical protein